MGLQDSKGMWQKEQGRIEGIILDYFAAIFKSDHPNNFEASLGAINTQVTPDMNDKLLAAFKEDEVERALKQMHPTKSPGPNGMSPIFYQKYWDLVGSDVINCVLEVLNVGGLPSGPNKNYISLIPKVKNPQKITDLRPISLCNLLYKIISKVLANCLNRILAAVIYELQSTFVPGRLITNNGFNGVQNNALHRPKEERKGGFHGYKARYEQGL